MKYLVKVINIETKEVVRKFPCASERTAQRVESGLEINLNHNKYYVITEELERTK